MRNDPIKRYLSLSDNQKTKFVNVENERACTRNLKNETVKI